MVALVACGGQPLTDGLTGPDSGFENLCGGGETLVYRGAPANPGDTCGPCSDGALVCAAPDLLACVGALSASRCADTSGEVSGVLEAGADGTGFPGPADGGDAASQSSADGGLLDGGAASPDSGDGALDLDGAAAQDAADVFASAGEADAADASLSDAADMFASAGEAGAVADASLSDAAVSTDSATDAAAADAWLSDAADAFGGADARGDAASASVCLDPTASDSSSVAFQIDPAHTGAQLADELTVPLCQRWSHAFPGAVSYPLVADGMVFVTVADSANHSMLYALDARTGSRVWAPVALNGARNWAAAAFDPDGPGSLITVNDLGDMMSVDPTSGEKNWEFPLNPGGGETVASAPTAAMGTVYVVSSDVAVVDEPAWQTLYAIDETTGAVTWKARFQGRGASSPTLANGQVDVALACDEVYAFASNPTDGGALWHRPAAVGCTVPSGATGAASGTGNLFVRDPQAGDLVLATSDGAQVGTFSAESIPALTADTAFYASGLFLSAFPLGSNMARWAYSAPDVLASPPLVVGANVVVATASGAILVVDIASGSLKASADVGLAISPSDSQDLSAPPTGLAEAGGILFVPAGNALFAY